MLKQGDKERMGKIQLTKWQQKVSLDEERKLTIHLYISAASIRDGYDNDKTCNCLQRYK